MVSNDEEKQKYSLGFGSGSDLRFGSTSRLETTILKMKEI